MERARVFVKIRIDYNPNPTTMYGDSYHMASAARQGVTEDQ